MKGYNQNLKKEIVQNSFWNFISLALNRLGALAFTVILARFLMPENYGVYSIVLSVAMIFFIFADFGVSKTLVRYISISLNKNKNKISSYHWYLFKLKFILTIIFSLGLLFLSYPLAFYIFKNPNLFYPFLVASFYIFVLSFDNFYSQVFYSIGKVKYLSIKELLSSFLKIILVLGIFLFISSIYHVLGIFLSLILISLILILFSLFYIKKFFPILYSKSCEKINKKKIRKFAAFLAFASISSAFFIYIDSIMLGLFVSPKYVGYYRAAFSLVFSISSLITFPNAVLFSMFARINMKSIGKILDISFKYFLMVVIPIIFGLFIFGKYFIRALFGYEYLSSVLPLYFLSFLLFFTVLVGLFFSLFSAKGKPEIFAKLIFVICLINVFLNFGLIKLFLRISPNWAMAGAAIATTISWGIYLVASAFLTKKEFGFSIPFRFMIRPIVSSLFMGGALIYLLTFIYDLTLFLGAGLILFGSLIYIILMLLIGGINKEDFNLLKEIYRT